MITESERRFKAHEQATRTFLTPGHYAIVRVDGRAFHTYCRGLAKPADTVFMGHMDQVAVALTRQLAGVRLAAVCSDEISLLLTDWSENGPAEFVFGGAVQKLASVTAALATAELNALRYQKVTDKLAAFDGRAFSLPTRQDVVDYFAWRQADGARNALSMTARARFSQAQTHGLKSEALRQLLTGAGVDPNATPEGFRRGRVVTFVTEPGTATFTNKRSGKTETAEFMRRVPVAVPAPTFTVDDSLIP